MGFSRLFVANRGEIALRIQRAAKALGLETVQGVSAADRDSLPARTADRTVVLGPAAAKASYLDPRLVVHAARATGCGALHPGYGFLSERAELARLCAEAGIAFVGPRPETIAALGDKIAAKQAARAAGVPCVPGREGLADTAAAAEAAEALGYPVLCKAAAGGGGRGMFVARSAADIAQGFARASEEARAAFGDGTLYMERFVERARHIEVQVMGDGAGRALHFGERDCSVQRRYQKIIEEAPAAILASATRAALHAAAVRLVTSVSYLNAGTVEFLYDEDRAEFHFIEVNARIQVEHPVSEEVTGTDLVQMQLRIAAGEGLPCKQEQVAVAGHAIEIRINAEDPDRGFLPSPGRVTAWGPPAGEGLRVDSHVEPGYLIPPFYDSMVGKLIVRGRDRGQAVERLTDAADRFAVAGVATTLPLHRFLARHPDFRANRVHTRWLEQTALPAFAARKD
jgi:acetyl-CoA carboxylase biotin carboxylase subunit